MKIGVELRALGDAGELFADARALEAAGADSFWARQAPGGDDPWALLAAIAAVTWRARLVVVDATPRPDAHVTVERLSRGRLVVAATNGETLTVPSAEEESERWSRVDFPNSRDAWRELALRHEAQGTAGLVLPNDPRLLDLLRNPDVIEDRSDIKLAFG